KAKNYPLSDLILLDQERCIVCWRCIRYLQEWEDKPQLGLFHRGGETVIDKFPDGELNAYTSGSIIDLCPVGALTNRLARFSYRPWEMRRTDSICTQCGQGCNLRVDSRDNIVRRHVARENLAVNDEWICDKGRFATGFATSPERLQQPLARVDGKLQPVSWDEALGRVVRGLQKTVKTHGAAAVGAIGSAKLSNEANYLLGKFMRALVGTNNLDYREGSAVTADPRGIPALKDVKDTDLIVLLGCDPTEEMPVLANELKRSAIRRGTPVIIVNARAIELTRFPGVFLNPDIGAEVHVFDALTRATLAVQDKPVPEWLPDTDAAAEASGLSINALAEAAALLIQATKPFIVCGADYAWGHGGSDIVTALTNWVVAAGHGERLGCLRSQANGQGAGDMGMLPELLPGRRPLASAKARASLEELWQTSLPTQPGLGYSGMLASARGRIKAMYIMGGDPAGERPADAEALKSLDFLVVQDLFLTPTAMLADVVLPAASYVETDGTFTNTERRVQRAPQAVKPVGKAVADWAILMHLARRYAPDSAAAWATGSAEAVFAEITQAVPLYAGMSYESLGAEGQQWPWDGLPVERRLEPHAGAPNLPVSATYPMRLIVSSLLWDDGVVLSATPQMQYLGNKAAWLHPQDAGRLGVAEGDVVEIRSAVGAIKIAAHLAEAVKSGSVFVPFSMNGAAVGTLFDTYGPRTPVNVRKLGS
ncbi:MAG: molybdopterin-dependent oxidoreductase, partial [Caldilineales bacterium]|nr:molybdopterin-dependent oxidoreductase [Caldilineales bacterium]